MVPHCVSLNIVDSIRVEVICALTTLVFLCTDFMSPNCYTPECGVAIRFWLVSVFIGFYGI